MRYVILVYQDERRVQALTRSEMEALEAEYREFTDATRAAGVYLDGAPLRSTDTATTVRVRRGRRSVTHGPFAETKEQLGAFVLLEARDLNDALAAAARIPGARTGSVEVRPVRPTLSQEERSA